MAAAVVSANTIYEQIKTDFERLERDSARRGEWLQFSHRLVEAIMKCQGIVMDHQKRLIAYARGTADAGEYSEARQASKDAIRVLDSLSALHERTKRKLQS